MTSPTMTTPNKLTTESGEPEGTIEIHVYNVLTAAGVAVKVVDERNLDNIPIVDGCIRFRGDPEASFGQGIFPLSGIVGIYEEMPADFLAELEGEPAPQPDKKQGKKGKWA